MVKETMLHTFEPVHGAVNELAPCSHGARLAIPLVATLSTNVDEFGKLVMPTESLDASLFLVSTLKTPVASVLAAMVVAGAVLVTERLEHSLPVITLGLLDLRTEITRSSGAKDIRWVDIGEFRIHWG